MNSNQKRRVSLVGVELLHSTGGPSKSISMLADAINARVYALVQKSKLEQENFRIPGTNPIYCYENFLGSKFALASRKENASTIEKMAESDVLSCHTLYRYSVNIVKSICRRKNIPYWVFPHGSLDPYVFTYRKLYKKTWFSLIGKSFLNDAFCIVCNTEMERKKIAHIHKKANSRVIRWPVVYKEIFDKKEMRSALRKELNLAEDTKILVYLARLHELKRPIETIVAFAKANLANAHLLIVGPAETISVSNCKSKIAELRSKNIHVLGAIYDEEAKLRILCGADGFISLSLKENFCHSAAEAMSSGLPLILSPGNDLGYDLKDEECGWLLQSFEEEEVIECLRNWANSSESALESKGSRGKAWVKENLSYEIFQKNIMQLLKDTLA